MKIKKIAALINAALILSLTVSGISAEEYSDEPQSEIFYGDINGDMKITGADYIAFMKYYIGYMVLTDSALKKADIDHNGLINIVDTVMLKSMVFDE